MSKLRSTLSRIYHNTKDEFFLLANPPVNKIIEEHTGDIQKDLTKLCFFASYDQNSIVHDYVIHYLKCLHDSGFKIIFISTSEEFNNEDISKLKKFCFKIIRRSNVGLDFGSWYTALSMVDVKDYTQLLLANDSVYGPVFNMSNILSKVQDNDPKAKLYGLIKSEEISTHLPSFFLLFNQGFLHSKTFERYWKRFRFYKRKERIIREFEVAGGSFCIKHNVELVPFFNPELAKSSEAICSIEDQELLKENPTLLKWAEIIEQLRFPFIKTEVLKANRFQFKNLNKWKAIVRSCDYPELEAGIQDHLDSLG